MEKMILEGVEVQFNDLSVLAQEKLYLQDKSKFQSYVAKSEYAKIRKLLIEDEECEAAILDEIFKVETEIYGCIANLGMIWKHPKFEKTDKKRKMLAESDDKEIRCILAEDEETSSELLNEMLRTEVQGKNNGDVTEAIIQNSNFEIEEESIRVLANSDDWENRVMAAEEETDSSRLNEMLKRELQGENDSDVIEAIVQNCNFEIGEENISLLANSSNWNIRVIAAEEETDSSRLNEMIRKELQGENDNQVIQAIIANSYFKMEEETAEKLIESGYKEDRAIVARDKNVSEELLKEMYLCESNDVIKSLIEDNLAARVIRNHVKLSLLQKVKIWNVLRRASDSNKYPISKYLNEILEIIG